MGPKNTPQNDPPAEGPSYETFFSVMIVRVVPRTFVQNFMKIIE